MRGGTGMPGGRAKHHQDILCEEKQSILNKGQEVITRNSKIKCNHWNPV